MQPCENLLVKKEMDKRYQETATAKPTQHHDGIHSARGENNFVFQNMRSKC